MVVQEFLCICPECFLLFELKFKMLKLWLFWLQSLLHLYHLLSFITKLNFYAHQLPLKLFVLKFEFVSLFNSFLYSKSVLVQTLNLWVQVSLFLLMLSDLFLQMFLLLLPNVLKLLSFAPLIRELFLQFWASRLKLSNDELVFLQHSLSLKHFRNLLLI